MIRGVRQGEARRQQSSNQSQPMRRLFWLRRRRQLNQMRRTSCRNPFSAAPVVRHAEVAVMAAQNAGVPAMLFGQRRVHQPPRLLAQRLQLARQAVALRLVLHNEPAVPGPPAVVGEAEEGEGFRTPLAALLLGSGPRSGRTRSDASCPRGATGRVNAGEKIHRRAGEKCIAGAAGGRGG